MSCMAPYTGAAAVTPGIMMPRSTDARYVASPARTLGALRVNSPGHDVGGSPIGANTPRSVAPAATIRRRNASINASERPGMATIKTRSPRCSCIRATMSAATRSGSVTCWLNVGVASRARSMSDVLFMVWLDYTENGKLTELQVDADAANYRNQVNFLEVFLAIRLIRGDSLFRQFALVCVNRLATGTADGPVCVIPRSCKRVAK